MSLDLFEKNINNAENLSTEYENFSRSAWELQVVLGEHDMRGLGEEDLPRTVRKVARVIIHEDFNNIVKFNNDLALILLSNEDQTKLCKIAKLHKQLIHEFCNLE